MYLIKGKDYPCCTSVTMGMIGGKWKTVILAYLTQDGPLRYSELRKKMVSVTERTLSLQLRALEQDGIVKRKVYTTKPPLKVEYALTEFGQSLAPVIYAVIDWGEMVIENYSDKK